MNSNQNNWRKAYNFSITISLLFLISAFLFFEFHSKSLFMILSAPALFFIGCLISFFLMVQSGGALAAISWFVLGSGIYFGLGVVAGGLHVHPHADYLFGDDTSYLLSVNLINAISVFTVLLAAYPLANTQHSRSHDFFKGDVKSELKKIIPILLVLSAFAISLKFILFPIAQNLLIRSIADKVYLIIPTFLMLVGVLWDGINMRIKFISFCLFLLSILVGLIALTKYQILLPIVALTFGFLIRKTSFKVVLFSLLILVFVFTIINPIVTASRAHVNFNPDQNTLHTRMQIVWDSINQVYFTSHTPVSHTPVSHSEAKFTYDVHHASSAHERLKAMGRRFDVATVQGYLIQQYNKGNVGSSLENFWVVLIPRLLWPQKPIVTNYGVELNAMLYFIPNNPPQLSSSTAPTFSAESYWNYGILGLLIVSLLIGLAIGWLTLCWQKLATGNDLPFLFIAFPVAIWASSVESWLVSTYLGEFIIFIVIYSIMYFLLKLISMIEDRVGKSCNCYSKDA